jgi:hypothetical protein
MMIIGGEIITLNRQHEKGYCVKDSSVVHHQFALTMLTPVDHTIHFTIPTLEGCFTSATFGRQTKML